MIMRFLILLLLSFLNLQSAIAVPLHLIALPDRFKIDIYAELPNARQMALGDNGIVFVGTLNGKVYAVLPNKDQTRASRVIQIASGLNAPNGVAYRNGSLYVAEIHQILKYSNINSALTQNVKLLPQIILPGLPKESHHGYRYIKFGPDGWLYLGIGMPCNICLPQEPRLGSIVRIKEDGSNFEIYALGVRNSMGFDWDPRSQELWFTDNGADWLGENQPPDELNWAPVKGMHFGFPFFHATLPDSKFNKYKNPNIHYVPPVYSLGAHVAALGMVFYNGKMFPPEFRQQILIAEHGSWNRMLKSGYRITRVSRNDTTYASYRPFVVGWLQGQQQWGRPVDLLVMADGAVLISDDYASVIYRLSYK